VRGGSASGAGVGALDERSVDSVFRDSWWPAVAAVAANVHDLELAEDAVQDACLAALNQWVEDGIPANPKAWLVGVARNKAIDRIRREALRPAKEAAAIEPSAARPTQDALAMIDEQLALIFTCCHPSLELPTRVALTLRSVCGLSTAEIAAAFLVPEATMAKRLVRGKHKIRDAGISFRVPAPGALQGRLNGVLKTIYLIFTAGHLAPSGQRLVRDDLCDSAIRLAREMYHMLPDEAEVEGLLALLLLTDARRPARTAVDEQMVLLEDQDRQLWDASKITDGLSLLNEALLRRRPGPYQLWAAITACHMEARTPAETDWREIVGLYDALLTYEGTDMVRANRAVAVAMLDGPAVGLSILDSLRTNPQMENWPQLHIARAELLRRVGRTSDAAHAYRHALTLESSLAVKSHIKRRLAGVQPGDTSSGRDGGVAQLWS